MMFDCGITRQEKHKRLSEWHSFYAIFPRTIKVIDGYRTCAAFQYIERKGERWECISGGGWSWEYRLEGDNNE